METLPDEIIALTFSFLPTRMLVREVRAVCHKWRGLSVHPDAWRKRGVQVSDSSPGQMTFYVRVLSLAPCLGYLRLDMDDVMVMDVDKEVIALIKTTRCAVRHLRLDITGLDTKIAAAVLLRQSALGRLRKLFLNVSGSDPSFWRVLKIVGNLHLEKLKWESDDITCIDGGDLEGSWGRGSLKQLTFDYPSSDPLFELILSRRASSLEALKIPNHSADNGLSDPWVSRLTQCTQLRKATLPWVLEVASLAGCPALTELTLRYGHKEEGPPQQSLIQLTSATIRCLTQLGKLKKLALCSTVQSDAVTAVVLDVLSALAFRCRSGLEELRLPRFSKDALLEKLQIPLPGFLSLRTLYLEDFPSKCLLDALGQRAAPNLSTLFLTVHNVTLLGVRRLGFAVQRNPRLHVVVKDPNPVILAEDYGALERDYGLYGHAPLSKCHLHAPSVDWHWTG